MYARITYNELKHPYSGIWYRMETFILNKKIQIWKLISLGRSIEYGMLRAICILYW